ncbi:MAG: fibronectin type III domain-containing protein [Candidatus Zixiibacteriota bacterium]|nr:MAG: fibronectin type III domain-containing protein [candidate division Zixibacteria bacterium]
MFRTRRLKYLATFLALLCVLVATAQLAESEQDTLAITIAPPADLLVKDTPDDGGGSLTLTWKLSPDDTEKIGDIGGYEIFRASRIDTSLQLVSTVGDNTSSFTDVGLEGGREYSYAVRARMDDLNSPLVYSNFARPRVNWFRSYRLNMLVLLLVFSASVLLFIRSAKGGKSLFIRKLAGLEAVEEAVGRATEMGKPVLFIPGISELDEIQTIAGLSILGRVARITAQYETPLVVPVLYPMALAAAGEVVKGAYLDSGRPENFKPDIVRYVAGEQFAYVAAVNGIMLREKPAANIYMGAFYAESLLLAETGFDAGAIQIAGTAMPEQLPFFIAACDYTLMGEELYAASAYLSKEPLMLGSLKGQDLVKIILVGCIILGVVFEVLQLGDGFFTRLFLER